jgi:hypothetical protein
MCVDRLHGGNSLKISLLFIEWQFYSNVTIITKINVYNFIYLHAWLYFKHKYHITATAINIYIHIKFYLHICHNAFLNIPQFRIYSWIVEYTTMYKKLSFKK